MKIILVSAIAIVAVFTSAVNGQGYGIPPPAIDPLPLTDIEWDNPPSDPQAPQYPVLPPSLPQFPDPPSLPQDPAWIGQPAPYSPPNSNPLPVEPQDPSWTNQGRGKGPGKRQRKPKRPRKPKRNNGNKCQRLAKQGSCGFYKCFEKIEPTCLNQGDFFVQDLESFCQNSQIALREKQFSKQGRQYIKKVRKCQTKHLLGLVNSQSCESINNKAVVALLGEDTAVGIGSQDCYWQNQHFCDIICNPQDNQALVQVVFNDSDGDGFDDEQIELAEHFQNLSNFCSEFAQGVFQDNFINQCPPGTLNDPPAPSPVPAMMMRGGAGD